MDGKILELGVGLIAALMIIREVFNFLERKKNGAGNSPMMDEHVNDVRVAVSSIKDKVDDLYEWHNKTDGDGIPLWYVRRSLEESIRDLGEKIYMQIEVQTKILRHMERMEQRDAENSKRRAVNGNHVTKS